MAVLGNVLLDVRTNFTIATYYIHCALCAIANMPLCPSVGLSVTSWYYVKTAEHIVEILSPPDSPISFLATEHRSEIPTRSPVTSQAAR